MAFKKGPRSGLFPDSDSEGEEKGEGLGLNKDYAQRYDQWRNKEELMKMKARFGTTNLEEIGSGSDSDSTSTEEETWSEEKEKAFFKTLSILKQKDPKIYDPNVRFFKGDEEGQGGGDKEKEDKAKDKKQKKKKKEKPFLLKDHERTMILEKGGLQSSDEEEEVERPKETLTYHQELAEIKKGFSAALQASDDESDDDGTGLLKKGKEKSEEEKKQEDEDYRKWLKGEIKRLEGGKLSKDEVKELSFLRSYWTDEKLDEGEAFLRDYVLNKRYMEPEDEDKGVGGFNQIAHDSDEGGLSNDEQFENQREEFEHKYNFRFEEPDPEFIKRFPRTIAESMRREDERRKKHRDSAKERKQDAKERKREEVQRLKALKRKEITDKLKQLQEVTGEEHLEDLDIEGDFDPAEYDKRMQKVFNEEYYKEEGDVEKPEFPYDPAIDDEGENWKAWVPSEEDDQDEDDDEEPDTEQTSPLKKKKKKPKQEVEEEEDHPKPSTSSTSNLAQELIEISKGGKKWKKPSPFLQALEKQKPKFDPKVHKSFEQYFKEYYSLDFEDLIGDLPCRFKYRKVAPNDFGLSTEEILKAPDRELNQWASLKKTYQYRANEEEQYEAQAYRKKAENELLKKRTLMSVYLPGSNLDSDDDADSEEADKNAKAEAEGGVTVKQEPDSGHEDENGELASSKKKKKKKKKTKKKPKDEEDCVEVKIEPEDPEEAEPEPTASQSNGSNPKLKPDSPVKIKQEEEIENPEPENGSGTSQTPQAKLSKRQRKNLRKHMKPEQSPNVSSSGLTTSKSPAALQQSSQAQQGHQKTPIKNWKPKKHHDGERDHGQGHGQKRKAESEEGGIDDERLKAYGMNPKKYKKWVKYGDSSQHRSSST